MPHVGGNQKGICCNYLPALRIKCLVVMQRLYISRVKHSRKTERAVHELTRIGPELREGEEISPKRLSFDLLDIAFFELIGSKFYIAAGVGSFRLRMNGGQSYCCKVCLYVKSD